MPCPKHHSLVLVVAPLLYSLIQSVVWSFGAVYAICTITDPLFKPSDSMETTFSAGGAGNIGVVFGLADSRYSLCDGLLTLMILVNFCSF